MKPYRIVDESEAHVTYEYRTVYTWTLYVALLVLVAGMVIPDEPMTVVAGIAIAAYFVAKLSLGREATERIKKAMKSNTVQISGSKSSFSNPLRIRVPK